MSETSRNFSNRKMAFIIEIARLESTAVFVPKCPQPVTWGKNSRSLVETVRILAPRLHPDILRISLASIQQRSGS
eukprot:3775783-Rhodomonas_salina.1